MGVISPSSIERTKVSSYRLCAFLAGWAISTLVPTLKDQLGGGDEAMAFQILMGVFAVISVGMFDLLCDYQRTSGSTPSSLQIYELISGVTRQWSVARAVRSRYFYRCRSPSEPAAHVLPSTVAPVIPRYFDTEPNFRVFVARNIGCW